MGATLAEALRALAPHCPKARVDELVDVLPGVFESFGIVTKLRQAHFLAQTCHESLGFVCFKENLNYSPSGLINTFPHIYRGKSALAFSDSHHAEQIANRVYAHKNGNGDFASGDGWKFHGRGMIQLTGHDNYEAFSKHSGKDAIQDPDLLSTVEGAAESAAWYWLERNINKPADEDDVVMVTKLINGGTLGLNERKHLLGIAKSVVQEMFS